MSRRKRVPARYRDGDRLVANWRILMVRDRAREAGLPMRDLAAELERDGDLVRPVLLRRIAYDDEAERPTQAELAEELGRERETVRSVEEWLLRRLAAMVRARGGRG